MPRSRPKYPPDSRHKLFELVEPGRSPEELAKEVEPWAQTTRNLTGAEREELTKLRRELQQVKLEREILAKAAA